MTTLLVCLHVLAAVSWIGGMVFLSLVLAPLVRSQKDAPHVMTLFRSAVLEFRPVVWMALAVLLTTGPMLLVHHGINAANPASWPGIVTTKLTLVALLLPRLSLFIALVIVVAAAVLARS